MVSEVIAYDKLRYWVDVRLENDRASDARLLPFFMSLIPVINAGAVFVSEKVFKFGNGDIAESYGVHA